MKRFCCVQVPGPSVVGWVLAIAVACLVWQANAVDQSPAKSANPKSAGAAKSGASAAKSKAGKPSAALSAAAKSAGPATPEQAARVLDLRTFPVIAGAKIGSLQTLGMLTYEAPAASKVAFEFQREQLKKLGFQELPGGYSDATMQSGYFSKDGFQVAVSTSAAMGDPSKAGWSNVSLVNRGNVDLGKLPVPPGAKPFYPNPQEASYTTATKPAETAAACRKLLLAAGWEPYGQTAADPNQPESSTQYFKRNAIELQAWVMTTPAEEGKTLIRYSTELLSVDLPAPPDATDPRYTDSQKTLRMDEPAAKTDAIVAFYQEQLPKLGWQATTERPISDDRTKSQFLVFRNGAKELLSLDLRQFTDIVRVSLKHQTAAELAAEEKLAKAHAEKVRLAEEKRNLKIKVAVILPAAAENVEQDEPNLIEFNLASGSGPAALEAFRQQFAAAGWTEEEGARFEKNTGELEFQKDGYRVSCSYFETGILDADLRISASNNVILERARSSDQPAAAPPGARPKKSQAPAIPGLPALPPGLELPPGVELPDEVNDLLKKALEESQGQTSGTGKKSDREPRP